MLAYHVARNLTCQQRENLTSWRGIVPGGTDVSDRALHVGAGILPHGFPHPWVKESFLRQSERSFFLSGNRATMHQRQVWQRGTVQKLDGERLCGVQGMPRCVPLQHGSSYPTPRVVTIIGTNMACVVYNISH